MAITFLQQASISNSTELRMRVGAALAKVAGNVRNESASGQSPARAGKRQMLAMQCRLGVDAVVLAATRLIAENAAVQGASQFTGSGIDTVANTSAVPDGDIEFVLSQEWDVLAGVLPSET